MTIEGAVAVIGGTGNLGGALAKRWAQAGLSIIVGSRNAQKAQAAADLIGHDARGATNADAALGASVIVIAVPFSAYETTLQEIREAAAGKIVLDTTVPLAPPKVMRVQLPPEGSAAVKTQALLGENITVISAFHNVAAHKLATDEQVECDVLVFGDDKDARGVGIALARAAGLRGLHGGALVNSAAAEALTSILIFLNKTYKVDGAGLRITGQLTEPHG